ncbi:HNH endonuclease [Escherichia coli]|nr:HNH endonuclease [Escherichia coli]MCN8204095.1 HNH endonuclease [Escherichia coli]HAI3384517.1 HNH endonuclease [Escherichia coli]HAL0004655.1 HNH endonuclease [Escherichia coli]HAP1523997.1 HNH endonuclease [Escherichia coli]
MSKPTNMTPPPDELRSMLRYEDSERGDLYWLPEYQADKRRSGAIGSNRTNGYRETKIQGRRYYLHRLIYWFHTGEWPEMVDHIDRNRSNCRIDNLRKATRAENRYNCKKNTNNTANYLGVQPESDSNGYRISIYINGKQHYIHGYKNEQTAALARDVFARLFYGERATLNLLDKATITNLPSMSREEWFKKVIGVLEAVEDEA